MTKVDTDPRESVVLSVVIPTHNKVQLLEKTLAALRNQDIGRDGRRWEILVVDDGSTDGTGEFLNSVCRDRPGESLVVRTIHPGRNVGRARARNLGGRSARGDWLLFLDDDIVAPAGLVRAHLDLLENNPGCGTIGFAVTEPRLVDGPHFHYLDTRGVARLAPGPAPGRYFVTQNAAVPREAFLAIGGFDEGFSGYGFEDMELAFRLEDQAGIRFLALTDPVPQHVHHHTLEQYFEKKRECGRQSLGHIARLHPGRIPEMKLHHVVDFPGQGKLGLASRLIRGLAASELGRSFPRWLGRWPVKNGQVPRLSWLYFKFMNLAVLFSYRQGFLETSEKAS